LAPQALKPGFDAFGYNYQARLFSGSYANVYLGRYGFPPYTGDDASYLAANPTVTTNGNVSWAWPFRRDTVSMKWNDAWLSNKDCDGDGALDRHFGFSSYIGSGAWLTNHQSGDTSSIDGSDIPHWTYFTKIVAAPTNATSVACSSNPWEAGPCWYTTDGSEIGYGIWGEFAVIQEVYNDPGAGAHGILYKSPTNPSWGIYKP